MADLEIDHDGPQEVSVGARLSDFLVAPRESLGVEIKRWLDLSDGSVRAKLSRHLMALANHGGGWLLFGFQEQNDGTFIHEGIACPDPSLYSADAINGIVQKYARPAFQCDVHWESCDEPCTGPHALVRVPGGHKSPIVCCKNGPDPDLDPVAGAVYDRLPGPKSERVVQPEDWDRLLQECLRNRAGEIVEMLQRAGIRVSGARPDSEDEGGGSGVPAAPQRPPREPGGGTTAGEEPDPELASWDRECSDRLKELMETEDRGDPYAAGFWSFAYEVEPPPTTPRPLPELKRDLEEVVGRETGWPAWWLPTSDPERMPHPAGDAIECWMAGSNVFPDPSHADYWRASGRGQLYLLRGYDEDGAAQLSPQHRHVQAGAILDPVLPIWRTGECLLHADRFARRLGAERVSVLVKWTGLRGRRISALDPLRYFWPAGESQTDEVSAWLTVNAGLIDGALAGLVHRLTAGLYAAFDFFEVPEETVERELDQMRGTPRA